MFQNFGVHMKGGVITERDSQFCTVRIRLPAGIFSVEQMRGIATIAKRYGKGYVHCTSRQTVEIPHVDPKRLVAMEKALRKNGTPIGSERDEIVNIIACAGNDRCKFANINTASLAKKIDQKLFGKLMPVKVRIAISGCPNACTSPMLNEIGIMGRIRPLRIPGQCTGCGHCVEFCKENAILIRNGLSELNEEKCVQCGVCVQSCPFDLLKSQDLHYLIMVGGRRGRHPHQGKELVTVPDEETVVFVIEKIVDWVYRRAWSGRLLSDQMSDLQFEDFKNDIKMELEKREPAPSPSK
jgi:dissimilatory sulfite reductase (desulfoviridin) alpha/beta subunit